MGASGFIGELGSELLPSRYIVGTSGGRPRQAIWYYYPCPAATGAIALTGLPSKWATPLVEVGALPAHAQISCCGDNLQVTAVTTTKIKGEVEEFADFDLWGITPDETEVYYGNLFHQGLQHHGDNIDVDPYSDTEEMSIATGSAVSGMYEIWVDNEEDEDIQVAVTVRVGDCVETFSKLIPTDTRTGYYEWHIANVTYPCGTITRVDSLVFSLYANGDNSGKPGKRRNG